MKREVGEILAENVEKRLKHLGRSKEWLGSQSGTTGAAVRKALSEARSIRVSTLVAWAKALKTTPNQLLGFGDAPPPRKPNPLEIAEYLFECCAPDLDPGALEMFKRALSAQRAAHDQKLDTP